MARRFVEKDHPRWPRGSGDKAGEFRDKTPDWASRVSDALPAAGGGSTATGMSTQCPICGRVVKVVGNGKRSTHNKSKGVRCTGSGGVVDGPAETLREMRKKAPARKKKTPGKPDPGPRLTLPPSMRATVDHPDAKARMAEWRASAGTPTRTDWDPIRLRVIKGIEKQIEDHTQSERFYGRKNHLENLVRDEMNRHNRENIGERYYDPWSETGRVAWGWDRRIKEVEQEYEAELSRLRDELARVKAGGPSDNLSVANLDLPDQSSYPWQVPATEFDPEHPLAVYGNLLHFDDSWLSYVALSSLEQRVPPEYHREMSRYLAETSGGGIWIGTASIPDQDNLGNLRGERPRGWHEGATWDDVDGVVSAHSKMAVGFTPNTESAFWRVRRRREQVGLPAGELHDYTATLHEFGHLADYALGYIETSGTFQYRERASKQRMFRILYNKVLREAGPGMNPYFRQKTKPHVKGQKVKDPQSAGAEEFWADAFGTYMMYDPVPAVDGMLATWPGLGAATQRQAALSREYDVPLSVAKEIEAYFDRHHKDLIAGRRTAYTNRRRI